MLCNDYPTALALSPCTEADAKIYVGSTALPVSHVRLRSQATGRVLQYDAIKEGTAVYFEPDGEVIVGHTYLFKILANTLPISFLPYVGSGYSIVADTTAVDGVYGTFERAIEGDTYFEQGDQYLTLQ